MSLNATLTDLPELYARFPRVSIIGVGDEGNDIVSRIFEDGGSGIYTDAWFLANPTALRLVSNLVRL